LSCSLGGSCLSELVAKVLLANVFIPTKAFLFLGNFFRISWYIFLASLFSPPCALFFASFNALSSFNSSKIFARVTISSFAGPAF
jgi:hypothetical protein